MSLSSIVFAKAPAPKNDVSDFQSGEDDWLFEEENAVEYLTLTWFAEKSSLVEREIIFGA